MPLPLVDLRRRLGDALGAEAERAYALRHHDGSPNDTVNHASRNTQLLGLLLAGASAREAPTVRAEAAGYGSRIGLHDLDTGERFTHRLMHAEAMDLDAGHVSIESPLGKALVGRVIGDVVSVNTPGGERRFRVEEVHTLPRWLDELEAPVRPLDSARRARRGGEAEPRRAATGA
jgi:transcription elongation GreA/GreB family factor